MGGRLSAHSEEGVGSTFGFAVPATECLAPAVEVEDRNPTRNYGKRVLLAEDNLVNRAIAARTLEALGLEVIVAENGQEAVERLAEQPDLVLMDIQMPVMSGLEAAGLIRQRGFVGPILAMTANVMTDDIERYLAEGMDGHIPKPFMPAQLVKELDRFLRD